MSDIRFCLRPSREELEHITENLRPADFEEFVMGTGRHPWPLLVERALANKGCVVAKRDGVPAAVFGCTPEGSTGAPWLLGTPLIEGFAVARHLIGIGRMLMNNWAGRYENGLKHWVLASNAVHIEFLERIGCEIGEPEPYGPLNHPFRPFTFR